MKFRPLDFDYHAEAAQRLEEKKPPRTSSSSTTLWLLPMPPTNAGAAAADRDTVFMDDSSVSSGRSIDRDSVVGDVSMPQVVAAKTPFPGNAGHDETRASVTNRSETSPPAFVKTKVAASLSASTVDAPTGGRSVDVADEEESPVKSTTMSVATPASVATAANTSTRTVVCATPGSQTAQKKKEDRQECRATITDFVQTKDSLVPPATLKTPAAKFSHHPKGVAVVTDKKVTGRDDIGGSSSSIKNDARASSTVQDTKELFPTLEGDDDDDDEMEAEMEPGDGIEAGLLSKELSQAPTTSTNATESVAMDAASDMKMSNVARSSHIMETFTTVSANDSDLMMADAEILTENMTVVASIHTTPERAIPNASFVENKTTQCRPSKKRGIVTIEHQTKTFKTTLFIDFSKCSPWLLKFLGSIRRRRNVQRLANQLCHNPYVVSFLSRGFPSPSNPVRPFWMERMILSLQQQSEAYHEQQHAKATRLNLQQRQQIRSEDMTVVDKLTLGGSFGNWKVGSRESRHRLLEGEKGTMVVYTGIREESSRDTLSGTNVEEVPMEAWQKMAILLAMRILENQQQQPEQQQPTAESENSYLEEKSTPAINAEDTDTLNTENVLLVDQKLSVSEPSNPAKRQKRSLDSPYQGPYSEEVDWLRRYPSSDSLQNQNLNNNETSNSSERGQESRHGQSLEQALPNETVRLVSKKRAEASSVANEQTIQQHQQSHKSHQSMGIDTLMYIPRTNANIPAHHVAKRQKVHDPQAKTAIGKSVITSGQEKNDKKQNHRASGFVQDSFGSKTVVRYVRGEVRENARTSIETHVPLGYDDDLQRSPPPAIVGASASPAVMNQTLASSTTPHTIGAAENPQQSITIVLDHREPSYGPAVQGQSAENIGRDSLQCSDLQRESGHSSKKKVSSKEAQKADKKLKKLEKRERKKRKKERKGKKRKRESTTSVAINNTPVEDDEIICLGVRQSQAPPSIQTSQKSAALPKSSLTQHILSDSDIRLSRSLGKQQQQQQQQRHHQKQQQPSEVPPSSTNRAPLQNARPPSAAKIVLSQNATLMKIVPGSSCGRQHRDRSAPQRNHTSESQQALTAGVAGAFTRTNSHQSRMKQSSYVPHDNEATYKTSKRQPSSNLGQTKRIIDAGAAAPHVGPQNRFAELPPIHILCSESFIEIWGEAVAQLASGRWTQSLFRNVNTTMKNPVPVSETLGQKMRFCDTHLVDDCEVSFELPNRRAVVIIPIKSTTDLRQCTMRMVSLAACERYRSIDCVLCVEGDFNPTQASQIIQVQTGFTGDLCQVGVHYFLASETSLSCCLAGIILSSAPLKVNKMNFQDALANAEITSRAHFLISLLPTMTASSALSCFQSEKNPRKQFQRLLSNALKGQKMPNPSEMSNSKAMAQLSHVLKAHLGGEEVS